LNRRAFHFCGVLHFRLFPVCTGLTLFALGVLANPKSAAPAENPTPAKPASANAPEQQPPAAATGGGAAAASTPEAEGTPDAEAQATATAVAAACKKTVATLGSGDLAALKPLTKERKAALLGAPAATRVLTCLAVAGDSDRYCESLPADGKRDCAESVKLARELRKLPKGAEKAFLIHRMCLSGPAPSECDQARKAMIAGEAAECGGLVNASIRHFCTAMASGDATKCGALEGDERKTCEAYVSDDPGRCPKESLDCQNITRTFAAVKKDGLAGAKEIDPAVVAVRGGKQACTPLLADLEAHCSAAK
jgi:hypothetical protein